MEGLIKILRLVLTQLLSMNISKKSRKFLFHSRNPSFELIFSDVVYAEIDTFVNAIKSFIQISSILASQ